MFLPLRSRNLSAHLGSLTNNQLTQMQEKLQELQSKLSDEELEKSQLLKQLTEAQKKFEGQLRLEEVHDLLAIPNRLSEM